MDSSAIPARHSETLPDQQPVRRPVLTIDSTTAHIVAPPEQAEELLTWFQVRGIACTRQTAAGIGGLDAIDFGNPSPEDEKHIHCLFTVWQQRAKGAIR